MRTIIQVITIVLFGAIFLYSQIAEETWETQVDNVRSVEPALAIIPSNSDVLSSQPEYDHETRIAGIIAAEYNEQQ